MRDRIFFTNRQKIVFMISIFVVLILIPVIVYSIMGGFHETELSQLRAASSVRRFLYLILLPFYGLTGFLIFQSFRQRIQVTSDRVRFFTPRGTVMLYWHEINDFSYDYLRIGSFFNWRLRLFRIADGLKGVRFYENLPIHMKAAQGEPSDFSQSSIRSLHVYRQKSYGIELSQEDCEAFAAIVKEKTRLEPLRKADLFSESK